VAGDECLVPGHAVPPRLRLSRHRRRGLGACGEEAGRDQRRGAAGQRHRRHPLGRQDRCRCRSLGRGSGRRAGRLLQQIRHDLQPAARRSRPFRRSAVDELRDRLWPRPLARRVHGERASLSLCGWSLSGAGPGQGGGAGARWRGQQHPPLHRRSRLCRAGDDDLPLQARRQGHLVPGSLNRIHKDLRSAWQNQSGEEK
jgi:hypothetical protein